MSCVARVIALMPSIIARLLRWWREVDSNLRFPVEENLDPEIRQKRADLLPVVRCSHPQENAAALKKGCQVSTEWSMFRDEEKIVRKPSQESRCNVDSRPRSRCHCEHRARAGPDPKHQLAQLQGRQLHHHRLQICQR